MEPLGERLGPLLLQFPDVARGQDAHEDEHGSEFLDRLAKFLPQLPSEDFRFAVEVRNGRWLREALVDLLRERGKKISSSVECFLIGQYDLWLVGIRAVE